MNISVVVPVGPNEAYLQWLPECVNSILTQEPDELVLVDDMANLDLEILGLSLKELGVGEYGKKFYEIKNQLTKLIYWKTPWLLGVGHAFNMGVALATNELIFMTGSDDKMLPGCLEAVVEEYEKQDKADNWYNVTTQVENGDVIWIPNNDAAVTKGLWKLTGGFPVQGALGAPDALLLSILMVYFPDKIVQVKQGTPYIWARQHEHQMTKHDMAFYATSGVIERVRDKETKRWEKPAWTERL